MFVKVENVTQSKVDSIRNQYGSEFSRWVNGTWEKYRLTPEEIEAKVEVQVGNLQLLRATYEPLRMTLNGHWSPTERTLTISIGGGDNWIEDTIECNSLAYAERLMARRIGELAPEVETRL